MANYFVSSSLTSASDNFRPLATTCSSTTNAGRVITEGKTPQDIGAEIFDKMVAVANGELTKAEVLGHKEFGIYRIGDTF